MAVTVQGCPSDRAGDSPVREWFWREPGNSGATLQPLPAQESSLATPSLPSLEV